MASAAYALNAGEFCRRYAAEFSDQSPEKMAVLLLACAADGRLEPHRLAQQEGSRRRVGHYNESEFGRFVMAWGHRLISPEDWQRIARMGMEPSLAAADIYIISRPAALRFAETMGWQPPSWWQPLEPATPRPAAHGPVSQPKGKGGAPRKYPWDKVGAAFGAWLHDEPGRARLPFRVHYAAVTDLLHLLGCNGTPDQETVRPLVRAWADAYLTTLGSREG